MLSILLLTLSSSAKNTFGIDDPPSVSAQESTEIWRGGRLIAPSTGTTIELEKGDLVKKRRASTSSGVIILGDKTTFSLIDNSAKMLFIDDEDHKFLLQDGTIYFSSKGKVLPPEPPQPVEGEPLVLASVTIGRQRLVRTSQRSIGTRGTEFRLQFIPTPNAQETRLKVIEGFVVCSLIDAKDDGPEYGAGANVKFRDAPISTLNHLE